LDPISFGRLWPETAAAVRRHADLLWPLAAAFLFLPQLLLARHIADRTPDQIFVGDAFLGDAIALGLLLLVSTVGQLAMARIVWNDGTGGQTLGAELRTAIARLPAAMAALFMLVILFTLAAFLPASLAVLLGGSAVAPIVAVLVAGVWLAARLGIVIPLLATDHPEPISAIGSAWRLTKGRALRIIGMLAMLFTGFLLLVLAIGGIGAAVGVISTIATGQLESGWGIGRWLFELVNAAASAAVGTFYIAFLALLARALTREARA
jgi:hypothetical protein